MKASYGRAALVAALVVALGVSAAAAGQPNAGVDLFAPGADGLPPPAETGKPRLFVPPPARPQAAPDCVPVLPCDTRLIGRLRRNGAVEIRVPALRW